MSKRVKHVGVRPGIDNPLVDVKRGSRHYLKEHLPEGGFKIWSSKSINSGCDAFINANKKLKGHDNLIYCPVCGEWRRDIEFEEANDDK